MPMLRAVLSTLPRGALVSDDEFVRRHRLVVVVLALQVPLLLLVAIWGSKGLGEGVALSVVVAAFAVAARLVRHRMRADIASVGLLVAAAALIELTGGAIEAHFAIFVSLTLVALYQRWTSLLSAIVFVVVHHFGMSVVRADAVFSHSHGQDQPLVWTLAHAAFVVVEVAFIVMWWAASERDLRRISDAATLASHVEAERRAEQDRVRGRLVAEGGALSELALSVQGESHTVGAAVDQLTAQQAEISRHSEDLSSAAAQAAAAADVTGAAVTRVDRGSPGR
jgi:methyl-accepting chemotaxis protein